MQPLNSSLDPLFQLHAKYTVGVPHARLVQVTRAWPPCFPAALADGGEQLASSLWPQGSLQLQLKLAGC